MGQHYVLIKKGIVGKEKLHIPKHLAQGFRDNTLRFNASKDQLEAGKCDSPPGYHEHSKYKNQETLYQILKRRYP